MPSSSRNGAIVVENLGKRYQISHQVRQDTLRDSLAHGVRGLLRGLLRRRRSQTVTQEDFWALRDLNFSIEPGEVVGVIGRNGAGKSTLLKILSRITEPTTGRVTLNGRVASLLEVGTGFHPELSGRENIYLNGAILGMSRAEIRRKFDEIVAFAEVDRFLDTPVKRYSSGMYVRLAFAVAAHMEPEILIVDEVLAVGDAQFQKKCLGKMRSVAEEGGRTVLFVSHNMSVMLSLCRRALLLEAGKLGLDDHAGPVVERYLAAHNDAAFTRPMRADARAAFVAGQVAIGGTPAAPWVEVAATVEARTGLRAAFEVRLLDAQGQPVAFGSLGSFEPAHQISLETGRQLVRCRFSAAAFANGSYRITLRLCQPFVEVIDTADNLLSFDLEASPGTGASHHLRQEWGLGFSMFPLERL
jgi:lipopolysaccharide transport system ATP-binding protein